MHNFKNKCQEINKILLGNLKIIHQLRNFRKSNSTKKKTVFKFNIGKYFNISAVHEDVEFFSKFLEMNDDVLAEIFETGDKSLSEKLIIPVAQTYELLYSAWGSCTYDDYMGQKFDSYDMNWVEDSAEQQRQEGNWDLYNGYNIRDTVYDNFDSSDHSFDEVRPVSESVKESLLDRLVLENTSEVVSSLDRQTLLKLKSIIDSFIFNAA